MTIDKKRFYKFSSDDKQPIARTQEREGLPNQSIIREAEMKSQTRLIVFRILLAVMLLMSFTLPLQKAAAAYVPTIPYNATITRASVHVFVLTSQEPGGQTIKAHQVTSPWTEGGVTWNSFNNSYYSTSIDSTVVSGGGWYSFDIKSLMQAWVNGSQPNYGILLKQSASLNILLSSESSYNRPYIYFCYTAPSISETCITLQRSGDDPAVIADTFILETQPNANFGSNEALYTGWIPDGTKMSLISFQFNRMSIPGGQGCTPGFWKQTQHFSFWTSPYSPYSPMTLFSTAFNNPSAFPSTTLLQALEFNSGGQYALARHAAAALLNAAAPGVDYPLTVAQVISQFNAAFAAEGTQIELQKNIFEQYNEQWCPLSK